MGNESITPTKIVAEIESGTFSKDELLSITTAATTAIWLQNHKEQGE